MGLPFNAAYSIKGRSVISNDAILKAGASKDERRSTAVSSNGVENKITSCVFVNSNNSWCHSNGVWASLYNSYKLYSYDKKLGFQIYDDSDTILNITSEEITVNFVYKSNNRKYNSKYTSNKTIILDLYDLDMKNNWVPQRDQQAN